MNIEKINLINFKSNYYEGKTKSPSQNNVESNSTNLNSIPHYKIISCKFPVIEGHKAICAFNNEYGEIRSPELLEAIISQKIEQDDSPLTIERLQKLKSLYQDKYDKLQEEMMCFDVINNSAYLMILKKYIKQHGTYINSSECAALIQDILKNRNMESTNLYLYSKDSNGKKDYKLEHAFTVINLDKDATIDAPETWGDNAVICDAWSGISLLVPDAVEFYKDFFNLQDGSFGFDSVDVL